MKTRTDKELKGFARLINAYSFNYAMGKKYNDPTLMDVSLERFTALSNLLNSEGYYVERVGKDYLDNLGITYSTYEVRESDL